LDSLKGSFDIELVFLVISLKDSDSSELSCARNVTLSSVTVEDGVRGAEEDDCVIGLTDVLLLASPLVARVPNPSCFRYVRLGVDGCPVKSELDRNYPWELPRELLLLLIVLLLPEFLKRCVEHRIVHLGVSIVQRDPLIGASRSLLRSGSIGRVWSPPSPFVATRLLLYNNHWRSLLLLALLSSALRLTAF